MEVTGDEKGSTLLEILVALALASLVLSGLMAVYWLAHNTYTRQAAAADAQYSARMGMQKIVEDVRGAMELQVLENGVRLSLITANGENIEYYRGTNKCLYRKENATIPIAENIASISFRGSCQLLSITIQTTVEGLEYTLQGNAMPRSNFLQDSQ